MANWLERDLANEEKCLFEELNNTKENFLHFKLLQEKIDTPLYLWFKENLSQICNDCSIPFFDANQMLLKNDTNNKWLFVDRAHLTDYGNELIAEQLLQTQSSTSL